MTPPIIMLYFMRNTATISQSLKREKIYNKWGHSGYCLALNAAHSIIKKYGRQFEVKGSV